MISLALRVVAEVGHSDGPGLLPSPLHSWHVPVLIIDSITIAHELVARISNVTGCAAAVPCQRIIPTRTNTATKTMTPVTRQRS